MNSKSIRKLTIAAMLVAVAVVGQPVFHPNVWLQVLAGAAHGQRAGRGVPRPRAYAFGMAFVASLLRNLLGLGTLLAFPGSMIGALLCGLLYKAWPRLPVAYAGEVFGTGILGGMASYPVAALLMNNASAALFTFVPSFLLSTAVGAAISVLVLAALGRTQVLSQIKGALH